MADNYEPQDLGRVTPIYRGVYDSAKTYELNDAVLYTDGNLYWHTGVNQTIGISPADATGTGSPWTLAFSGKDLSQSMKEKVDQAEGFAENAREYAEGYDSDGDGVIDLPGAKQYAAQAHAHEEAAKTAKLYAEDARDKALRAKEDAETAESAANTHAGTAQMWAEGAPTEPEGGKSAKTWAAQAQGSADTLAAETAQIDENKENIEDILLPWMEAMNTTVISNPEYLWAVVDHDNHVLIGAQLNGNIWFGAGVPAQIRDEINQLDAASTEQFNTAMAAIEAETNRAQSVETALGTRIDETGMSTIESPEYLAATVDAAGGVISATLPDGTVRHNTAHDFREGLNTTGTGELGVNLASNPEYLAATVDASGRVLSATLPDGTVRHNTAHDFREGLNTTGTGELGVNLTSNPEYLAAEVDAAGGVVSATLPDGTVRHNTAHDFREGLNTTGTGDLGVNLTSNPEYLAATVDAAGGVVSATLPDGTVRHNTAHDFREGLTAEKITLSESGLTDFEKALKEHGFTSGTGDWSDSTEIHIPIPDFAMVNITGISAWPTSKFVDTQAWLEFHDFQGNSFKKRILFSAQGSSSLAFSKKNGKFDLCNSENPDGTWNDDDTFSIRFGGWVPQDSFHLKAFHTDAFRGIGIVGYWLMDEIMRSRGMMDDRPWKRALIDMDAITVSIDQGESGPLTDPETQFDTGARCIPDGFPCAVYLNGAFYGIYAWQIKKHRDNMHQNKKTPQHIHLDGLINSNTLLNGSVNWSQFEIRNPKSLKDIDGNKYDGDNPKELSDDDEHSAKVKGYITALSNAIPQIKTASDTYESSGVETDLAALKTLFETFFEPDNVIDYTIFSQITYNYDGFAKNWQWLTWDGVKWYLLAYDLDGIFGAYWKGDRIRAPTSANLNNTPTLPSWYVLRYYKDRLEARYRELRRAGILDAEHIAGLLGQWCARIGVDFYEREFKKWPLGQTFKNGTDDMQTGVAGDSVYRVRKWLDDAISKTDTLYHYAAD